jgi:hypothetical protein
VSLSNWYVSKEKLLPCGCRALQRASSAVRLLSSTPPTKAGSELTDSTPSRRVQAIVGLRLLEMIRDQDLPVEIMEAEDTTQTMPRRLGLSDVVDRKIRTYRKDVKKRVRLSDGEVMDLFRLVIRRPDGEEVFYGAGRLLAAMDLRRRWTRVVPRRVQYAVARGRVKRRLKRLFGRRVGGFGRGPFTVEGRALVFIESDPGGEACHFLSGFCQEILEQTGGGVVEVKHTLCQGRGDDQCRWEGLFIDAPDQGAEAGD